MTPQPISLLSKSDILSVLSPATQAKLTDIEIHQTLPSTNDRLWQRFEQGLDMPAICISEEQTAGRGRRGDQWQSPASGNLYLSLFWPFSANRVHNGLSIAIGVALINSLKSQGINGLKIKWPNDILYEKQKLAGILVESRFRNRQYTVVGIGLNFKLPTATKSKIDQPTTSLQQFCTEIPCRSTLAGHIIQNMIETIELFQARGLESFLPLWPHYDALDNADILLINDTQTLAAKACGINEKGELRYQHNGDLHTLTSGLTRIRFA